MCVCVCFCNCRSLTSEFNAHQVMTSVALNSNANNLSDFCTFSQYQSYKVNNLWLKDIELLMCPRAK